MRLGFLCLLLCVLSRTSEATTRLILLQGAGTATPKLDQALQRMAAELRLEGYEPRVEPWQANAPPVEDLEATATQQRAFGALVLVALAPETVRVLSYDGTKHTWVLRTLAMEHEGDAASVLSIRTVEILRAHFLERRYKPELAARVFPAPPPSVADKTSPRQWAVGLGLARAMALPDEGVWAPQVWATGSWSQFALKASFTPAVTDFAVGGAAGVAHVSQQAGWMSVLYHLRSRARMIVPYISASAGAARLQAQGSAQAPFEGVQPSYVTPLVGGGAGCVWWATTHWGLSFAADVVWFTSAASVQIDGVEQRRLGQPQVIAALGSAFAWGQGK